VYSLPILLVMQMFVGVCKHSMPIPTAKFSGEACPYPWFRPYYSVNGWRGGATGRT